MHRWLLDRRAQLVQEQKVDLPWFEVAPPRPAKEETERENDLAAALRLQVLDGMTAPADLVALSALSDEERLRWYVANVVDYHRSEAKPAWWEYFSRCANADTLAESDNKCIGDLTFRSDIAPYQRPKERNFVYTYSFPEQQHSLEAGDDVHDPATQSSVGELVSVDDENLTVEIKRSPKLDHAALRALVPKPFTTGRSRKP